MSRAPDLAAIDCPTCGAGLDILGGGRVTTHICPYCGTALDALDGYKALRRFSDLPRPDTPFAIGGQGRLFDVDWTVIGLLQHRETWQGRTWVWIDHQLYSPTHGYAWLTLEDGHLTFSRRVRGLPATVWMSERWVETAETPPALSWDGERYKYLQTSTSTIVYAEGEFTWSPDSGTQTVTISAMSDSAMLDFALTGTEREVHRSRWLPAADVLEGFGLPRDALKPRGVHAIQPYRDRLDSRFLTSAALLCAAVALVLGLLLAVLPGRAVLQPVTVPVTQLPRAIPFDIDGDTQRLAGVYLSADVSNSWAYLELELTDPEDEVLFEAGRTMEYYFGTDADGAWSEGSRDASLHFLPTVPGTYTLTLNAVERDVWQAGRNATAITVSARQGMSSGFYLFLLCAGFVALALCLSLPRILHHRRRWAHGDWSDD